MVMNWIFTAMIALALLAALLMGRGSELAAAIPEGAQAGVTLAVSMAGSLCLWSGIGRMLEAAGFTAFLSRLLKPLLTRVFPTTKKDKILAGSLSANICANFLGLGNAATPMGIRSAQLLVGSNSPSAGDELCRLIVLNTASIQLIPATVAAIRTTLGCKTPFDILPAVWLTSLCSAGMGLIAAWALGRLWRK